MIGSGGAGKSTFARRLGKIIKVEVIHLDSLYWNSDWVETPKAVWLQTVAELVQRDAWIMDGNYSGTFDVRVKACDTLIFLDMPRLVCLWRVLKRRVAYRGKSRPDMAAGCPEQLDWEFTRWVWDYPKSSKSKIIEWMRENSGSKNVVWLRSPSEVESYLAGLQKTVFADERR